MRECRIASMLLYVLSQIAANGRKFGWPPGVGGWNGHRVLCRSHGGHSEEVGSLLLQRPTSIHFFAAVHPGLVRLVEVPKGLVAFGFLAARGIVVGLRHGTSFLLVEIPVSFANAIPTMVLALLSECGWHTVLTVPIQGFHRP